MSINTAIRMVDRVATTAQPVAESMVQWLVDAGVDTFFGLPGGPIISVFHRILLEPRARLIEPRHETAGVFEAMGYWRASARVPAVVVTAGPGITNAVTGVTAAYAERVPMLILCGDVATGDRRLAQDLGGDGIPGIEAMFAPIARAVRRIGQPSSALGELRRALSTACDPARPGPVVVVVPIDRADAVADMPRVASTLTPAPTAAPPPPALIDEILERLARADRPLLVLGGGCRGHEAPVGELVDALGLPFMTTPQAKGIVSDDHPTSLRSGGMSASHWARRYTASEPDVALVLGTDLDDTSTAGTPVVGAGGQVIHVDTDPTVFARNFPTSLGVDHRLESIADALTRRAFGCGFPRDGRALAAEARRRSPFDRPEFATDDCEPIAPHRVIADLEAAARSRDRFVTDIGEHMLFALHYLSAGDPERFTIHLGLGSMGSGIGSAIGLALGDRSRRVICICGDGGMQMTGAELLVAIEHRLPVVFAVFNDARYNMVYHGYRLTHGREQAWATPQIDFVAWARALGASAQSIDRPGQITTELLDALCAEGPAVLDIRHDRELRIAGDGRIEALRQMSFGAEPGAQR